MRKDKKGKKKIKSNRIIATDNKTYFKNALVNFWFSQIQKVLP